MCETTTGLSTIDAIAFCRKYGMELFAMTTKEEFVQGISWLTQMHGTGDGCHDHMNGVNENGTWYVYNPNKQPLYLGAYPVGPSPGDPTGTCLKMRGNGSAITIYSTSCTADNNRWSFCEV